MISRKRISIAALCVGIAYVGCGFAMSEFPDRPVTPAKPVGDPNFVPPALEGLSIKTAVAGTAEYTGSVAHGSYASTPNPNCKGSNNGDSNATCVIVGVSGIPITTEIAAVHVYAKEGGGGAWQECAPNRDCPIGWARFIGSYNVTTTSQSQKSVRWEFRNWSADRNRDVRMVVTFSGK
jgi:hypothetical protein